jgi:NAD(P)-dependent dehydrogenase (short-subunit alcohol dehydrogenase family)
VHFVLKPKERMNVNLEYAQGIEGNRGVYLKLGYAWWSAIPPARCGFGNLGRSVAVTAPSSISIPQRYQDAVSLRRGQTRVWSATQAIATELAEHRIPVNALTLGLIITAERLAMLQAGTLAEFSVLRTWGAVTTREKLDAAVKSGGFAQMLTTMMPLGHPGYPDEIAKAVLLLASELASYVSGANLIVDGAQTLIAQAREQQSLTIATSRI